MYMIRKMLEICNSDSVVRDMLVIYEWIILLVFNVDGYVYIWKKVGRI